MSPRLHLVGSFPDRHHLWVRRLKSCRGSGLDSEHRVEMSGLRQNDVTVLWREGSPAPALLQPLIGWFWPELGCHWPIRAHTHFIVAGDKRLRRRLDYSMPCAHHIVLCKTHSFWVKVLLWNYKKETSRSLLTSHPGPPKSNSNLSELAETWYRKQVHFTEITLYTNYLQFSKCALRSLNIFCPLRQASKVQQSIPPNVWDSFINILSYSRTKFIVIFLQKT